STCLLVKGWWRGQVRWRFLERSLLLGAAAATVVYGLEGLVTEGRIWQGAFWAGGAVGGVHPAGWGHGNVTWLGVSPMTAGLMVLLAAAGLAAVAARPGMIWKTLALAGTGWVVLILVLLALRRAGSDPTLGALAVVATMAGVIMMIPLCAVIGR